MCVEENKNSLFNLAELKDLGGYRAGDLLAVDSRVYSKFMKHLSRTVKRDNVTKSMVFLTGLSTFTQESINLLLKSKSARANLGIIKNLKENHISLAMKPGKN